MEKGYTRRPRAVYGSGIYQKETSMRKKGVLGWQTAFCVVGLLLLLAGRTFDLGWYEPGRQMILQALNEPDRTPQVRQAIARFTGLSIRPETEKDGAEDAGEAISADDEQFAQKLEELEEYIRRYGKGTILPDGKGGEPTALSAQGTEKAPDDCLVGAISISPLPDLPVKTAVVTSVYGFRQHPVSGEDDFHTGIDLAVPQGERVSAAWAGTVSRAGWSQGYGNGVLVSHGNGLTTFYAHLSSISVREGEILRQGEMIGRVGSTGVSTGPHLHWEVSLDGKRIDPGPLLNRFCLPVADDER